MAQKKLLDDKRSLHHIVDEAANNTSDKDCAKSDNRCFFGMRKGVEKDDIYAPHWCFAPFNYGGLDAYSDIYINLERFYRISKNKKGYRAWVNYVTKRSPVKDVFIKNTKRNAYDGGVYVDVNCHYKKLLAATIALRQCSEFPECLDVFMRLRRRMDEDAAFFIACIIQSIGKDQYKLWVDGGHSVYSGNYRLIDTLKVFNGVRVDNPAYGFEFWGGHKLKRNYEEEKGSVNEVFASLVKQVEVGEGWNKRKKTTWKSLQPFIQYVSTTLKLIKENHA